MSHATPQGQPRQIGHSERFWENMFTHLQQDILDCEVKWAFRSITTNRPSEDDGISAELFIILKDGAIKGLNSITANLENSAVTTGLEKVSSTPHLGKVFYLPNDFSPIPKKGNVKECSYYHTIVLISHASKVMLKILQIRLQQYVNQELSAVQAGFGKGDKPEIKLPTFTGSWREQGRSRKTSTFASLTKAFDCGSQQTGKFLKR